MTKKIFNTMLPLFIWIIIITMLITSIAKENKLSPCKEFLTIKNIAMTGKQQTDTLWINYFQLQKIIVAYSAKDNSIGIEGIINNQYRCFVWSEKLSYYEYIGNDRAVLLTEEQIIPLVKILLDKIILFNII